jgi:hypothetical protein
MFALPQCHCYNFVHDVILRQSDTILEAFLGVLKLGQSTFRDSKYVHTIEVGTCKYQNVPT